MPEFAFPKRFQRRLQGLFLTAMLFAAFAGSGPAAFAETLRVARIFSSNMVLQQGKPVTIWGWAEPETAISVQLQDAAAKVQAAADGRWQAELAVPPAGGPYEIVIEADQAEAIRLSNVLVGEVWIASGQSNMAMSVARSDNATEEIKQANWPAIRFFSVQRDVSTQPLDDLAASNREGWVECTPQTATGFSAAAYYFGRELHQSLNVPIGLVNTSWGGTRAEAWTSQAAVEAEPTLQPLVDWWQELEQNYDAEKVDRQYDAQLKKWEAATAKAKQQGKRGPRKPRRQPPPEQSQHRIANLYNAMLAPLVPLSIRGAIWYQGEANVRRAAQYRVLFPIMIQDWRARFGQGDFPFGFVQLAPYTYSPDSSPLPELWEAQLATLKSVPNTGMAVTTDVGNPKDIHPKNKQAVGRRLALWALADVYEQTSGANGPVYHTAEVDGHQIRIRFDHVGKGLKSRDGMPLTHFSIATQDGPFVSATATIEGEHVVVQADAVPAPAVVRFGWDQNANPNLVNDAGLPASPFRTDDRPLTTAGQLTP